MQKNTPSVIVKSNQPTNTKGCSLMSTLNKKQLNFNDSITISNDGGHLSSEPGILLVQEFLDRIDFKKIVRDTFRLPDKHHYYNYSQNILLKQVLFQMIQGCKRPKKDVGFRPIKIKLDVGTFNNTY